jgi:FKBP-type peptidyl-prolyl cis-trans isomerase FkpA
MAALGGILAFPACKGTEGKEGGAVALESDDDKTLYALGLTVGGRLKTLDLNPTELKVVEAGIEDAAGGDKARVELEVYGPRISALAEARTKRKAESEKEQSKAYLEEAAKEQGAVSLPSGLVYVEIQKGTGPAPISGQTVRVHYRGTLRDGTEFDSSHKRGQPAEFALGSVIPCWTEGLQKMSVGGKAKLHCPSSIAYGDSGRPPMIPPGATLAFEVELLAIL